MSNHKTNREDCVVIFVSVFRFFFLLQYLAVAYAWQSNT